MCKIKKILGSMLNISILLVILGFGRVQTEEADLDPTRFERAILNGNFGGSEIVGGGSPGRDFPALSAVPRSDFSCHGRFPGYYADEEYGCQVFHICHTDRRKDSFLCPNGTIFHQLRLVCDWWYNVDCASSDLHVDVNNDIGRVSSSREDENSRSNPPLTSFTSLSNFARTERPSTTPIFATQSNDIFNPTENSLSAGGFGIPLPTARSNFNNQNNQNRNRVTNDFSLQPTLPSTIPEPSSFQTPPRATTRSFTATPRPSVSFPSTSTQIGSSQTPSSQRNRNVNRIRTNVRSKVGVPLPPVTNQISPPDSTHSARIPDHFSSSKLGVPLPSLNNQNQNQRNRVRTSKPRRITVNKRPIGTSSTSGTTRGTTSPFSIPQPTSRTPFPPRQNDIPRDSKITTFNDIGSQGVAVLDDEKVTTQFFNIGSPRVVSSRTGSNVGVPLPTPDQQNNVNRVPGSNVGVPLPGTSRQTSRQNDAAQGTIGVPLPPTSRRPPSRINRIRTNIGVPLPSVGSQQDTNAISDNTIGVPLPQVSRQPVSRNNIRTNVGVPLPQVNRQPTIRNNNARTSVGVPLPPANEQTASRNNIGGRNFGVPLPPISRNKINNEIENRIGVPLPPVNQDNNARGNIGVPLPPPSRNQNRGSRRNNVGVPLPPTNRNSNNVGNSIGVPLPPVNGRSNNRNSGPRANVGIPLPQTNRQPNINANVVRSSRRRVPQNNIVTTRPVNDDRGPVTFLSSLQRNRGRINRLLNNNRNRATPSVAIIKDFDDDILDDLDDLNDPFDDDRFDLDDKFDDDRFDDDRFDDDRFDDDRFDDDRFDDDRFDDDRFDDDRFDDDRFDDDRFDDLDDRLDDLEDRFDNDLFDFDDEIIDDRLDRFGNERGFNFGRRPRGSTFLTGVEETSPKNVADQMESEFAIAPPSEIQLPPPPL